MMTAVEWLWETPEVFMRKHAWPYRQGTFRLRRQDDGRWAAFNRVKGDRCWIRLGDYDGPTDFLTYVRRQHNWKIVEEVAR